MRNPQTGTFEPTYTEDDFRMFKDWIKSGTNQETFVKEVQKIYKVSMWTAIKWYTIANKELKEGR